MNNSSSEPPQRKSYNKIRGYTGMGMGLFYFFVAYWVVYMEQIGKIEIGATFSYIAAALMVMYGLFRIYRGYTILRNSPKN